MNLVGCKKVAHCYGTYWNPPRCCRSEILQHKVLAQSIEEQQVVVVIDIGVPIELATTTRGEQGNPEGDALHTLLTQEQGAEHKRSFCENMLAFFGWLSFIFGSHENLVGRPGRWIFEE